MNYIEDLSTYFILNIDLICLVFCRSMMFLQRYLVDHDAKQSLYIHKLNRTKKNNVIFKTT